MPLLFKNKRKFIEKKQVGGPIPFYANYEVKSAESPLFNPGDLLKAYSQKLPEAKLAPKEIPDDVKKGLEITTKGKNNETFIVADKLGKLRNQIEDYYRNGVEPPFNLMNELKDAQLTLNNANLNNKARLDNAVEQVKEKDAGANIVYRNGEILVKKFSVDADGKRTMGYEWMDAADVKHYETDQDNIKEINKFNPRSVYKGKGFTLVEPLTHAEALEQSDNADDNIFLFKEGAKTANKLATGMSSTRAIGALEDAYFKQLGEKYKETGISNNDGTVLNAAGHYEGNNADALNNAKALVVSTIDQSIKDALMPQAWAEDHISINDKGEVVRKPTRTLKEANENLQRILTFQANKMLKIKTKDTIKEAVDPEKAGADGNGSATMSEIPSYMTDLVGDVVNLGIESLALNPDTKFMQDNKNVWINIKGRKAVSASQWLNNKINEEKKFYANASEDDRKGITDGVELEELASDISGKNGESPFTATSVQDAKFIDGRSIPEEIKAKTVILPGQAVNIYYMPVNKVNGAFITDSKVLEKARPAIDKYQKGLEELEKTVKERPNDLSVSSYNKQVAALKEELNKQFPDFELKPFYRVQGAAIVKDEEVDPKLPNKYHDVMSKPYTIPGDILSKIEETLGQVGNESRQWLSNDEDQTRKFDIFLPLEKTIEMWELQKPVYINKDKATIDYLNGVEQNKPM